MKKKALIIISVIVGYPIIFCVIGLLFFSYIGALLGFLSGIGLDIIFIAVMKSITHGENLYEEHENFGHTSNRLYN